MGVQRWLPYSGPFLTPRICYRLRLHRKVRPKKKPSPKARTPTSRSTARTEAPPRGGSLGPMPSTARVRPTISLGDRGPQAGVRIITNPAAPIRGVRIRNSLAWYDSLPTARSGWSLPLLDRVGKFTGYTVAKWATDPRSVVATMVATAGRRLTAYATHHNKMEEVAKYKNMFLRASYIYLVTGNVHLWDRVLYFSRNLEKRGRLIHRILLKFLLRTDIDVRFVYSHVCYQAKWLLFRALRPRDKSGTVIHGTEGNLRFKDPRVRTDAIWKICSSICHVSSSI